MNQNYGMPPNGQGGQHGNYMQQQMYQQQQQQQNPQQMGQMHGQQGYFMDQQQGQMHPQQMHQQNVPMHQQHSQQPPQHHQQQQQQLHQQQAYQNQPHTPQMGIHNQNFQQYQSQPHMPSQQQQMMAGQYQQQQQPHSQHQPPTPQMQQPQSQSNMPQPSPQYPQQHSVGSFHNPNSISAQPHTPQQQQLVVPQRSVDGRFTSPASVPQRSPYTQQAWQQQQQQQLSQSQIQQQIPVSQQQQLQGHQQQRAVDPSKFQPTPAPQSTLSPNPLIANKLLISRELRRALNEVSTCGERLLSSKFCTEPSNYSFNSNMSLSADTPKSVNPGSSGPSPNKEKPLVTEEDFKQAKERFVYAVTVFLNVCDDVDRNYQVFLEAEKEQSRYDLFFKQLPTLESAKDPLEKFETERETLLRAMETMSAIITKVRKAEIDV